MGLTDAVVGLHAWITGMLKCRLPVGQTLCWNGQMKGIYTSVSSALIEREGLNLAWLPPWTPYRHPHDHTRKGMMISLRLIRLYYEFVTVLLMIYNTIFLETRQWIEKQIWTLLSSRISYPNLKINDILMQVIKVWTRCVAYLFGCSKDQGGHCSLCRYTHVPHMSGVCRSCRRWGRCRPADRLASAPPYWSWASSAMAATVALHSQVGPYPHLRPILL